MIINETEQAGIYTVHRTEDEKPFAQLHAPRSHGGRKWGIRYRDGDNEKTPFSPTGFNSMSPNRKDAEYELRRAVKVGSDYQLGLSGYTNNH